MQWCDSNIFSLLDVNRNFPRQLYCPTLCLACRGKQASIVHNMIGLPRSRVSFVHCMIFLAHVRSTNCNRRQWHHLCLGSQEAAYYKSWKGLCIVRFIKLDPQVIVHMWTPTLSSILSLSLWPISLNEK